MNATHDPTGLRSELLVWQRVPGCGRLLVADRLYLDTRRAHWVAERLVRRYPRLRVTVVGPAGLRVEAAYYPQCADCHDPHRQTYRDGRCFPCWHRWEREGEQQARRSEAAEAGVCQRCHSTGPTESFAGGFCCPDCLADLQAFAADAEQDEREPLTEEEICA